MSYNTDWYPGRRADQIVLCRNWISVMTAEVRTRRGIPQDQFTALNTLFTAAETLREKAQSSDRTPVITEQCREAFDELEARARFFLVPPLINAETVDLGLTPQDATHTPIPRPEAQAEADITFTGIRLVELKNIRAIGTQGIPDPRSD
jgi:hypothetical protein